MEFDSPPRHNNQNETNMSELDFKLINEAKSLHCSEWSYIVRMLMPQAESDEARAELRRLSSRLYHLEEFGVRAL